MGKVVLGIYHDKEKATKAVEALLEQGVPVDQVSVILTDGSGQEVRSIPVKEDTGVMYGATVGGLVGTSLGAAGVTLVATGIVLAPGISLLAAGPILALLVGGSGLAGAAVGAPLGAGQWRGLRDVAVEELQKGAVVVAVHSDELAALARMTFAETGAEAVSDLWEDHGTGQGQATEAEMNSSRRTTGGPLRGLVAAWLFIALGSTACASMNRTEEGAAIGAVAGGIIGAVMDDNTARGAIIGAVVGGTAGAVIGREMDRQAEELETAIPEASVERIGEGIRVTFDSGLLFAFDSAELQSAARHNLAELAQSLGDYPNTDVVVVGHTDSMGSDAYNQNLSERRAASARSFLTSEGVPTARVIAEGRGESEPVASNDEEAGRSLNRRVEVAIFASEEYREELEARYGDD